MHQTRSQLNKKIPVERKGTKYIARASSHINSSVSTVMAVRDMLKLARTASEVKLMIHQKLLKINGKEVKDYRESIKLFNIFEAGKLYVLTFTPNGKFTFEETKSKDRVSKVINKKILPGKKIQLNLYDGSNVLANDKINVEDTVYLDFDGKIKKHVAFEKGKECIVINGKYLGNKGKIDAVENGKAKVNLSALKVSAELDKGGIVVI